MCLFYGFFYSTGLLVGRPCPSTRTSSGCWIMESSSLPCLVSASSLSRKGGSPHMPQFSYRLHTSALYRKYDLCIPRNETARPQSQFLHSGFCERFTCINSHDRSAYSSEGKKVDRFWDYINRSQIHECEYQD